MNVQEKIMKCLERHPDWDTLRIAKSTTGHKAMIEAIRNGTPLPPMEPPPTAAVSLPAPDVRPPAFSFSLKGVHLLSKKPQDVMKGRLYSLQMGLGYKVEDLARAWGVSVETLKNHAKNYHALVYVEATPGEYVPAIVHPDTPKGESI